MVRQPPGGAKPTFCHNAHASGMEQQPVSMNDLLLKGPDGLNPIRAVLLRFRRGVHAALGDIKKMYNSVWLEDLEMHLHRFFWRDAEDGEIEEID